MKKKQIFKKTDFLNTFNRPKSLWKFSNTELLAIIQNELGLSKDDYVDLIDQLENENTSVIDFDEIDFITDELNQEESKNIYINEVSKIKVKAKEYIKKRVLFQEIDYANLEEDNLKFVDGAFSESQIKYTDVFDLQQDKKALRIIDLADYQKTPLITAIDLHEIIKKHDYDEAKLLILDGIYFNEKSQYFLQANIDCCLFERHKNGKIKATVHSLKNSTTTKRKDIVAFYYDYRVLAELGYEVVEWNVVLIKYTLSKKNGVEFTTTNTVCHSKNSAAFPEKLKELNLFSKSLIENKASFKRSGYEKLALDYPELKPNNTSFGDLLDILLFNVKESDNKKTYNFVAEHMSIVKNAFDNVFDQMMQIKETNIGKIVLSNAYFNQFADNVHGTIIKYTLGKKVFEPFLLSGNVYKVAKFFNENNQLDFPLVNQNNEPFSITNFMNYVSNNADTLKPVNYFNTLNKVYGTKPIDYFVFDEAKTAFNKLKPKKVYFDFESICHLFAPMDDLLPNMQIVTQNSYIIDNNDSKELECFNDVIDPCKLDVNWFAKIINDLHQGEDYSYVVYNKSFEKSRLYEMAYYLERYKQYHPEQFLDQKNLDVDFLKKVKEIENNLFDLADFFNLSKKLLVIRSLNGFYSIKKTLLLTSSEHRKKAKAVDYATLNVKRGDMAQNLTAKRFLGLLSDQEWEQIAIDLAIYCENDVRSMIAVEYYIRDLLKAN
ncbi:DUF2779 domain-containing protein [Mycoplasmoides gallisepticum]|uniref:DUF2779 domain-containing protein n=1 Tax=Mycoplasmoides gallisepticum TaxID=2096 RepID=UPI0012460E45|nr:DUF2779 domain-containing protein [Mycoplasmoides gallisepticum]QEX47082.1 DUF2779 domain-containing protein [Mycoplasmoides gallisepticum]ULH62394.1 DUF2779 domain-containing protein [Mycoplasmoides gallisepticum]ULH67733.1 DUF2779 domain-containing protein [Mycoplasmoides gallisepticum]ULH68460.1 DUF2779 domain-containing protein [Mycoplasmoides gallisepticum]WGG24105.1 DUF2779 domain-containing protein [Mycoplasmoides gallisepticum]